MAGKFSMISVKAAAITGAVLGFLCLLLMLPFGMAGYGSYGMMGYSYLGFGLGSLVVGALVGAVGGAIIAFVYNWALKLK
ncbi:MAG: hypothetical protein KGH59_00220 [Candidatus Micrarchaeota archaeon]|nr:hypothetical protein [Candidatus Micrarchaeota archaeon]